MTTLLTTKMPAGRYYVGDLCYVMHNEWDEFCDALDAGMYQLKDGRLYAWENTAYGDGSYRDQFDNSYSVDAGLIGCILVDDIQKIQENAFSTEDHGWALGHVHDFPEPFTIDSTEGVIRIGHVLIPTGYDGEDE